MTLQEAVRVLLLPARGLGGREVLQLHDERFGQLRDVSGRPLRLRSVAAAGAFVGGIYIGFRPESVAVAALGGTLRC